ncbi:MAG: DNA/RNA nuclease SfsA [Clostridia bacterium]|nr:DNA/RNA nuclease SfsA [Clostridia bacterium]
MHYPHVVRATFLSRPNRFIAHVLLEGEEVIAHVKNTGRCKELLLPGCTVYLSVSDNITRKTKYDLIAVEKHREGKEPLLINMDSQIPNDVAAEWLRTGLLFPSGVTLRREVRWGDSRFDFYMECEDRKAFLEVKGVTLEQDGVARFPDAPTERGIKHLRELIACMAEGYEAYVLFVIQMKEIQRFCPNDQTHKAFGQALRQAAKAGVNILALDCCVTPDSIVADRSIPVSLES